MTSTLKDVAIPTSGYSPRDEAPRDGTVIDVLVFGETFARVRWHDEPKHPDGGYFGDLVQGWEQDHWEEWRPVSL